MRERFWGSRFGNAVLDAIFEVGRGIRRSGVWGWDRGLSLDTVEAIFAVDIDGLCTGLLLNKRIK